MKGTSHFSFDPEVNKALAILKNDKDQNVLEHIDDISVILNTESLSNADLDDKEDLSTDLLQETKSQSIPTSANDTNENLLDFDDSEERKVPVDQPDQNSDLLFASGANENNKSEELISFEETKEDSKPELNNLLDIEEAKAENTDQNSLPSSPLDSNTNQAESLLEQSIPAAPAEQIQNSTDLLDLDEVKQEPKAEEQPL